MGRGRATGAVRSREAIRLLVRVAVLSGATAVAVLVVDEALGGGGYLGLVLVLVGGIYAVGSLVNPRRTAHAGAPGSAAPLVRSLDPFSHWEPPGSAPVRRFCYGLGLLLAGAAAVVLLG